MKKIGGFTLIELLVAITIGILIVGFGSAALNEFNEKQKVNSTKEEIMANLRLARNYAVTNNLGENGNRVAVTISSSGIITASSLDRNDVNSVNLFTKNLNVKGIGISVFPTTIRFSVVDGRSFIPNGTLMIGTTATVFINNGGIGNSEVIIIEESGLIYEK